MNCPICSSACSTFSAIARSSENLNLNFCHACNFIFNPIDVSESLSSGLLETTRISSVGFDIPSLQADFIRGESQSKFYAECYSLNSSTGLNILDFGCSTGYFLSEASRLCHNVFGVELNVAKRNFVRNTLSLPCESSILEFPSSLRFDYIFLFYSLEYVSDFKQLILSLRQRLSATGKLIIITPNLLDPLITVWSSDSFNKFFFDFHSINYFSVLSLHRLMESLSIINYDISTLQGYSSLNHFNWLLHDKPFPSSFVGSDEMYSSVCSLMPKITDEYSLLRTQLLDAFSDFNQVYCDLIQRHDLGNQIHLTIYN